MSLGGFVSSWTKCTILCLLLVFCDSLARVTAPFYSRLECLQYIHDLGRDNLTASSEQWKRGVNNVAGNDLSTGNTTTTEKDESPGAWVYQAPNCPLHDFNREAFCTQAIGCDKKVLLVGDSTMKAWMPALRLVLGGGRGNLTESMTPCPTRSVPLCVRSSQPGRQHCDPSTHWGTDAFIYGDIYILTAL